MNKGEKLDLDENVRVYYFPNNSMVVLEGVIELTVSESGTHYLKTRVFRK